MFRTVLTFLTITNLYLYLKLRAGFGNGWWNLVYVTWSVFWAAAPFVSRMGYFGTGRFTGVLFDLSFTWAAIVGMACTAFFFLDVASLVARLFDWLALTNIKPRFFDPCKYVPVTVVLILIVILYSFYEAWNVKRTYIAIETSMLPKGTSRLRLVHLTDTHLGKTFSGGRFQRVMDIVRSAEPDILVLTGDITDGDTSLLEKEAGLLASHGAKWGAFGVTGNHEFYAGIEEAVKFMRLAGVTLLRDTRVDVAGITILGLDDPARFGRMSMSQLETMPDGLFFPEDRFVLFLKHRPQVIEGTEGKFGLQLSGHTHGGQIWPFTYAVRWANKHEEGLSFKGSSAVYASNGAGFWGPPLRFLAPPEVTVIDLVKTE